MQKQVFKEKKEKLLVGIFREQIRLGMLTPSETTFATGVLKFYEERGFLSERQLQWAWKLMMRVMMERDPFEPFPFSDPLLSS